MEEEKKKKSFGRKILTIVLTMIITIFVLFVILFSWLLIKNPLNVRGIILYKLGWIDTPAQLVPNEKQSDVLETGSEVSDNGEVQDAGATAPVIEPIPMSESQRQAVEDFGIDPDSIVITPAMEECFIEKLGADRVNEIIHGATPGPLEMFKASSCL